MAVTVAPLVMARVRATRTAQSMHSPVPWIGLAAIAAMFPLPRLDARGLLDGPRTIRRRTRRQVCADCQAPWTSDHQCAGWPEAAAREPVVPLRPDPPYPAPRPRVRLTHTGQPALPRPGRSWAERPWLLASGTGRHQVSRSRDGCWP